MRDARREAAERLGGDPGVRVLEPSPPADLRPPWFADDPLEGGTILPVDRPGGTSWLRACADRGDTALVTFCLERWLGPWRRLETLPASFSATRPGIHALAEHVLQPCRYAANGKIGLRWTLGGIGTPFFTGAAGEGRQVRVEYATLVDGDRRAPLTTIGDAAEFFGVEPGVPPGLYEPVTPLVVDAPIEVGAVGALADWFGFCTALLEQVRAEATPEDEAGRVQIWPEHLDAAVPIGRETIGKRANVGGSAGDANHAEPYLYVGPWVPQRGPFWNEPFGASLPYSAILEAVDQRGAALAFLRSGLAIL